ncbi:MAG: primase alpha helix C-terminal domain-containing protein [Alphaproteobacteria bacterium]|nr:primase alpha helix C-terminal domain-containing protein [Alphaproteobacteria bacterium]
MEPHPEIMDLFLTRLFGNELRGLVELAWRDPQDGKLRHAQLFRVDDLDALVEKAVEVNGHEGANCYIGAAIRHPDTAPFARASDDDFLCAPALWVDLDDGEAVRTARQKCGRAPPNIGVITGRIPHARAQLYWVADEAMIDPKVLRKENAIIAAALGGDPSVVNPGRVMRLAGSVAWPVKKGRVPELVELMTWTDRPPAYVAGEVVGVFPLGADALNSDKPQPMTVPGVFGKLVPEDRWVEMLKNGTTEGSRNTTAASLFGYLLRRDIRPTETWEIGRAVNEARFTPPLDTAELGAVFESICVRELKRRRRQ